MKSKHTCFWTWIAMVLILGATAGTPARASDTVVIGGTGMGLALAEKITELVASEGA